MTTQISNTSKVGYIFNESTQTWHPIAGVASTSANYNWSGTHDYSAAVTFNTVVNAKAGVNNFQNPTARDAALINPADGTVCFIRQDDAGNTINQIQYHTSSGWVSAYDASFVSKTSAYTIGLSDSGKTVLINSSSDLSVTVPLDIFPIGAKVDVVRTGTGEVSITPASSVTIRSKNSAKRLSLQYSGASLLKIDTNEWLLIGDLKV
jgi:hypothetical protein